MALAAHSAFAEAPPTWFGADYKSPKEWGFYCQGDGKTEEEALKSARSQCSGKMCMLFGVEVDSKTRVEETLKDQSVNSIIVESCPKVRVVGRIEKKKIVSCEDNVCQGYVLQLYPKTEYDKEYKRLNAPTISKVLEKTIVTRENDETFKDPAACLAACKEYSEVRGERPVDNKRRIEALTKAQPACVGLDYRNSPLQSELGNYFVAALKPRAISGAMEIGNILSTNAKIEDRVAKTLEFEKANLANQSQVPELMRWMQANYDALWYRSSEKRDSKGAVTYSLNNGKTSATNPYLNEMKTCRVHAELLKRWAGTLSETLNVCANRAEGQGGGQDCNQVSTVMVRYMYAGCVCNAGSPATAQSCTPVIAQYIEQTCPAKVTDECFKSMGKYSAEQLKMQIRGF